MGNKVEGSRTLILELHTANGFIRSLSHLLAHSCTKIEGHLCWPMLGARKALPSAAHCLGDSDTKIMELHR